MGEKQDVFRFDDLIGTDDLKFRHLDSLLDQSSPALRNSCSGKRGLLECGDLNGKGKGKKRDERGGLLHPPPL